MFGLLEKVIENAVDVAVGAMTFGKYGDFSKKTVSKMIADGVEIYTIASFFGVAEDVILDMIDEDKK